MKKNIGICILALGIIIILLFMSQLILSRTEEQMDNSQVISATENDKEPDAVISSVDQISARYYIMEDHGRLCVYLSDRTTVYTETGIPTWMLPEDLKAQLVEGIGFETEEALYDFLESYSS